ncbi:MAG: hypothetical protein M3280_10520 [Actinomycetota bacterium]|nr:hypothetical protein [Actinomycetota bacterium]
MADFISGMFAMNFTFFEIAPGGGGAAEAPPGARETAAARAAQHRIRMALRWAFSRNPLFRGL